MRRYGWKGSLAVNVAEFERRRTCGLLQLGCEVQIELTGQPGQKDKPLDNNADEITKQLKMLEAILRRNGVARSKDRPGGAFVTYDEGSPGFWHIEDEHYYEDFTLFSDALTAAKSWPYCGQDL